MKPLKKIEWQPTLPPKSRRWAFTFKGVWYISECPTGATAFEAWQKTRIDGNPAFSSVNIVYADTVRTDTVSVIKGGTACNAGNPSAQKKLSAAPCIVKNTIDWAMRKKPNSLDGLAKRVIAYAVRRVLELKTRGSGCA
jgi:hypothetical protein